MALLEAQRLTKTFGGLTALDAVDFVVPEGSIVSLSGPNGAGKTTFFNCVSGTYPPSSGVVVFRDQPVLGLAPHKITKRGMARTFQGIRLFSEMTVLENVMVGAHCRMRSGVWGALLRGAGVRQEEEAVRTKAKLLLDFVGLAARGHQKARTLSYGDQRRLEIAR